MEGALRRHAAACFCSLFARSLFLFMAPLRTGMREQIAARMSDAIAQQIIRLSSRSEIEQRGEISHLEVRARMEPAVDAERR